MLHLTDYYQPLNIKNLFIFVLILVFFDILGTFIKNLLIKNRNYSRETRLLNWLIGLGVYIFTWFVFGFFVRPTQSAILISGIAFLIVTLPAYIKEKEYLNLLTSFRETIPFVLLIIPLLPAVFVKSSLPPYYSDEMAYHFISPYSANNQLGLFWNFSGGIVSMSAPRLIDTFFILVFSLTKTYSIARLTLFSIICTSIIYTGIFLRKKISYFIGILFVLMFFSLNQEIVFVSTIGFVDISMYAFLILGILFSSSILFDESNIKNAFCLSAVFLAMSFGAKYTAIPSAISVVAVLAIFNIGKLFKVKLLSQKGFILKLLAIFLVFGGYWYIKNFIAYGNPIYPFVFPCWERYAFECNKAYKYFQGWTTKVDFENLPIIIYSLLPGSLAIIALSFISISSVLFEGFSKWKKLILFYMSVFIVELFLLNFLSGFYPRYHQHLQFFLLMSVSIFIYMLVKYRYFSKPLKILAVVIILYSIIRGYYTVVARTNSLSTVTWNEINYSTGKINIYDWIRKRLPDVAEAIIWCENPEHGPISLARIDPDMIWYNESGYMRAYLLNCYYGGDPDIDIKDKDRIREVAREKKLDFWTVSINPCINEEEIKSKEEVIDKNMDPKRLEELLLLRKLNNAIVCNSEEVLPNLYHFNYEKLKKEIK